MNQIDTMIALLKNRMTEITIAQRDIVLEVNRLERQPQFGGQKDRWLELIRKHKSLQARKTELTCLLGEYQKTQNYAPLTLVS